MARLMWDSDRDNPNMKFGYVELVSEITDDHNTGASLVVISCISSYSHLHNNNRLVADMHPRFHAYDDRIPICPSAINVPHIPVSSILTVFNPHVSHISFLARNPEEPAVDKDSSHKSLSERKVANFEAS